VDLFDKAAERAASLLLSFFDILDSFSASMLAAAASRMKSAIASPASAEARLARSDAF
jgi:hypothetical protein